MIWLALLPAVLATCPVEKAFAAEADVEQIVVRLTSGRTFLAAVDGRTDSDRLWLRFDRGGASILRPVAWQSIEGARHGQRALSAAELREAVGELRSTRPTYGRAADNRAADDFAAEPVAESPVKDEHAESPAPAAEEPSPEPISTNSAAPDEAVRSIAIDAAIARWTGGVESDGVLLRVVPLGADGQVIAVSGTLEVDLFGDHYGSPARGQDYRVLGHWVSRMDAAQVTLEGAAFRLPFQAVSADFADDLSPYAVVHVRFTAPGHGTFEASTNSLRLRAYNGVRDRLQQAEGTRFFPNERTNRSHGRHLDPR